MNSELLKEYIHELNPLLSEITSFETRVWWKCKINPNHQWQTAIRHRVKNNSGCPYCNGKKVLPEESLLVKFPKIAQQWDYSKNEKIPEEVAPKSNKYYFWKCDRCPDHSWRATVVRRTGLKSGCPYCSGHKVGLSNCLATTHPELSLEWDYEINEKTPYEVSKGCESQYNWVCKKNHKWMATPNCRTFNRTGCPYCIGSKGEELIQQILVNLKKIFIREYKFEECKNVNVLRFDFAVFEKNQLNCLIEYQGIQHYKAIKYWGGEEGLKKSQYRDKIKREYCLQKNIRLVEINYKSFDKINESFIKEIIEMDSK